MSIGSRITSAKRATCGRFKTAAPLLMAVTMPVDMGCMRVRVISAGPCFICRRRADRKAAKISPWLASSIASRTSSIGTGHIAPSTRAISETVPHAVWRIRQRVPWTGSIPVRTTMAGTRRSIPRHQTAHSPTPRRTAHLRMPPLQTTRFPTPRVQILPASTQPPRTSGASMAVAAAAAERAGTFSQRKKSRAGD